jgi:hypothetical protein
MAVSLQPAVPRLQVPRFKTHNMRIIHCAVYMPWFTLCLPAHKKHLAYPPAGTSVSGLNNRQQKMLLCVDTRVGQQGASGSD